MVLLLVQDHVISYNEWTIKRNGICLLWAKSFKYYPSRALFLSITGQQHWDVGGFISLPPEWRNEEKRTQSLLLLKWLSFFFFFFFTLQYCIGFAIHRHASTTGVHVFPILNPAPTSYHPSGLSQCTSPKHPVSCIEPGLIWYYTCFNAILPDHATLSFFQSPKVSSIHLCLFCCLAYRVIVTIFLNSIYMH